MAWLSAARNGKKMSWNNGGHYQHQDLVFDSLTKFMEFWKDGREAVFNVNCRDGKAWMSISTFLGYQDGEKENSFANRSSTMRSRPRVSPSKQRRNHKRAAAHREKKRQGTESSRLAKESEHTAVINSENETIVTNMESTDIIEDVSSTPVSVYNDDF